MPNSTPKHVAYLLVGPLDDNLVGHGLYTLLASQILQHLKCVYGENVERKSIRHTPYTTIGSIHHTIQIIHQYHKPHTINTIDTPNIKQPNNLYLQGVLAHKLPDDGQDKFFVAVHNVQSTYNSMCVLVRVCVSNGPYT